MFDKSCYLARNTIVLIESIMSVWVGSKNRPEDHRLDHADHKGRIFRSHPHTNEGFVFLLTIKYHILRLKLLPEVLECAEMRHDMMSSR